MKETYIQPELNVVKLGITQMLCGSLPDEILNPAEELDAGDDFGVHEFDFEEDEFECDWADI